MDFLLFFPIFAKGIKAKSIELESESDISPQNEGKVGKSELTSVVKALTNCAMVEWCMQFIYQNKKHVKYTRTSSQSSVDVIAIFETMNDSLTGVTTWRCYRIWKRYLSTSNVRAENAKYTTWNETFLLGRAKKEGS